MEKITFLNFKIRGVRLLLFFIGLFTFLSISSFKTYTTSKTNTSAAFVDTDGDGVPDKDDMDDDGDGILDIVEKGIDTDGDGIPNKLDIDSDNDGILDNVEAQSSKNFIPPSGKDVDGNGLDDAYEDTPGSCNGLTPIDTDHDYVPDYLDIDSDNDSILDNVEAQPTKTYIAPCGIDSDGNGLDDHYESCPGGGEGITPVDTDGDGHPDFRDIDSDDDGIVDIAEVASYKDFVFPSRYDTDGNGLDDAYDVDGHNIPQMLEVINGLDFEEGRPHVLVAHTTFGKGVSFMENQIKWHYLPLNDEQYQNAMAEVAN